MNRITRNACMIGAMVLSCTGMAQNQIRFSINGEVKGLAENTMVYLSYTLGNIYHSYRPEMIKDSSRITNGKFKFSGQLPSIVKATVSTRDNSTYIQFYLENSPITITGKIDTHYDLALNGFIIQKDDIKISGSKAQDEYEIFQAMGARFLSRKSVVMKEWRDANKAKDSVWAAEMQRINEEEMIPAQVAWHSGYILKYPDSHLSANLELWDMLESYAPDTLLKKMWDGLSVRNKTSPMGVELEQFVKGRLNTAIGKTAPDFVQNDTSGKAFKLSSLRGRYVLVDFWASWCKPCRAENPNLKRSYEKYKKDGFTVVGVSLDQSADEWKKAIVHDQLPWYHVSDLKFWKNEVAVQYAVPHVPYSRLIDPKGKVIAESLRGDELDQKLKEIFGH